MRLVIALPLALALTACQNPFGCSEPPRTVDVMFSGGFTNVAQGIVDDYRRQGYDCAGTAIRNAAGQAVGTSYTCTKC
jgi:hypothetical protein